jgi:hypothetical protein
MSTAGNDSTGADLAEVERPQSPTELEYGDYRTEGRVVVTWKLQTASPPSIAVPGCVGRAMNRTSHDGQAASSPESTGPDARRRLCAGRSSRLSSPEPLWGAVIAWEYPVFFGRTSGLPEFGFGGAAPDTWHLTACPMRGASALGQRARMSQCETCY